MYSNNNDISYFIHFSERPDIPNTVTHIYCSTTEEWISINIGQDFFLEAPLVKPLNPFLGSQLQILATLNFWQWVHLCAYKEKIFLNLGFNF